MIWRVWKYALGSFSDNTTAKYDNTVCVIRSTILLAYLVTNTFIVAGVIRHWDKDSSGSGTIVVAECVV